MDGVTLLCFVFGGIGASFYAVPLYLKTRHAAEDPFTLPMLLLAVSVGSVFGGVLVPFIGAKAPWTVDPIPYPLALGVGLLANKWLPRILDKGMGVLDLVNFGGPKK